MSIMKTRSKQVLGHTQVVYTTTHTRRNVYSCLFRSNSKLKKRNVSSVLITFPVFYHFRSFDKVVFGHLDSVILIFLVLVNKRVFNNGLHEILQGQGAMEGFLVSVSKRDITSQLPKFTITVVDCQFNNTKTYFPQESSSIWMSISF